MSSIILVIDLFRTFVQIDSRIIPFLLHTSEYVMNGSELPSSISTIGLASLGLYEGMLILERRKSIILQRSVYQNWISPCTSIVSQWSRSEYLTLIVSGLNTP